MEPANILTIKSLGEGCCDKDLVMLHACSQLLEDYVEQEKVFDGHVDWQHDDKTKKQVRRSKTSTIGGNSGKSAKIGASSMMKAMPKTMPSSCH